MLRSASLDESSAATFAEGEVNLAEDHLSTDGRGEQTAPSVEIEANAEPPPSITPHKSLSNGRYQDPSTSHPGHCQDPDAREKFLVLHQVKWDLLLVTITTSLFAITAWFAQATFSVSSMTNMK